MTREQTLSKIKGGLIVSCQALKEEPLFSSHIMGRMAIAAFRAGAVGIRANTVVDIVEIKKQVDLPIIGIIKEIYTDSDVYITPTEKEVDDLVEIGVEIIAMDATNRLRTGKKSVEEIFSKIRAKYPKQLFMADCSCVEDGVFASKIGFDIIGTTLAGYTNNTKGRALPALDMIEELTKLIKNPIIAEGGIHYPHQLKSCLDVGAYCGVVGGAITRPLEIAERFIAAIK